MASTTLPNSDAGATNAGDLQALRELVTDNADLELLEARISAFNIFEGVGMVGQEIHHSRFLAFLLDPSQNHGLADMFLKRFLSFILRSNREQGAVATLPVTEAGLEGWDLTDAEIAREQDHIDVRISIASHKLVVIIENKLYTGEHTDQLARYLQATRARYTGWRVLPIYLTLAGSDASDSAYLPVGYEQVADLVQETAERNESTMGRDANALLHHYVLMLRRHHLPDKEIDELCARIYQRHKRALDLIFERRPDRQEEIARLAYRLIEATPKIEPYVRASDDKRWIHFYPAEWSDLPGFHSRATGFDEQGPGLLFVFDNYQDSFNLKLQINPVREEIRQRLWQFAAEAGLPFKPSRNLAAKVPTIYKRPFLDASILDEGMDTIEETLSAQWNSFVAGDLAVIRSAVEAEFRG